MTIRTLASVTLHLGTMDKYDKISESKEGHGMIRLGVLFSAALFLLVVAEESASQMGRLAGLQEVRIVVENLGPNQKKTGLNRGDLTIHSLSLLKDKLPSLVINGTAESFLYINARLALTQGEENKNAYYGAVWVGVYRNVILKKTGLPISAMVWYRARGVTGTLDGANAHIQQTLERVLIQFAIEWSRDNPGN